MLGFCANEKLLHEPPPLLLHPVVLFIRLGCSFPKPLQTKSTDGSEWLCRGCYTRPNYNWSSFKSSEAAAPSRLQPDTHVQLSTAEQTLCVCSCPAVNHASLHLRATSWHNTSKQIPQPLCRKLGPRGERTNEHGLAPLMLETQEQIITTKKLNCSYRLCGQLRTE